MASVTPIVPSARALRELGQSLCESMGFEVEHMCNEAAGSGRLAETGGIVECFVFFIK